MNTDVTSTTTETIAANDDGPTRSPRRPGQTLACGWCRSPILLPARGRIPKWCSSSCRHRAWELTRAVASGPAAVQVVDRVVEVVMEVPVATAPQGSAWPTALAQLASQLAAYERLAVRSSGVVTPCRALRSARKPPSQPSASSDHSASVP